MLMVTLYDKDDLPETWRPFSFINDVEYSGGTPSNFSYTEGRGC